MNVIYNEDAQQWELKTKGILKELLPDPEDGVRENSNGNPYKLGLVDLTYPDGTEDTITASIWAKSLDTHPDKFKAGETIGLAINVDPNSPYAGNAKIELPGGKVNVSKITAGIKLPEAYGSAKPVAKKVTEKL